MVSFSNLIKKRGDTMNLFNIFKPKTRDALQITPAVDDVLLRALLRQGEIDTKKAMNIPAVASCVHLITETVAMVPIKLFSEEYVDGKRKTEEVFDDVRSSLLNDDTRDTLDGIQFKRALVRDYLLFGNAYAYIHKKANKFKSVNYIPARLISIVKNTDVIFKDYDILIGGQKYKPFEFLKILRSTEDGARGSGIIEENRELLNVAYTTLMFEQGLVAKGGSKRGFIQAKNRVSAETSQTIRDAWRNLYANSQDNMIILNDGLEFRDAGNTSVEMQLNENKKSLAESIQSVFGVPSDGNYERFIKQAIMPILTSIECALNRDLLLEKEKSSLYFAFDTKEITKGDIKTRFEAYKTALDSNLMQIDECRYMEDLEPLGLNFIKLGLQDVLYNPATKEVFTPNTGQTANIENHTIMKGVDEIEN